MTSNRIALFSQRMSTFALILIIMILSINIAIWLLPSLSISQNHPGWDTMIGLNFALTRDIDGWGVNMETLTWWQQLGGLMLSSIPLIILTIGLHHLRSLFKIYVLGDYFSTDAAIHLGKAGKAILLTVIFNFLCEPLLSALLTMTAPEGQGLITISFSSDAIFSLFLAGLIILIAQILKKASEVATENQQFV